MPKSNNQKLKLLYLKKMLEENTDEDYGMTLAQISAALLENNIESERKSLYTDFEALRTFGMDIEKKISKHTTYHVMSRDFELAELRLLVDAVQSSRFITHKKSNELIKKIESLTSRNNAVQLQRQVYVTSRIKTLEESIFYTVDIIHRAINENKKISFLYYEWTVDKRRKYKNGGARYVISPWALVWNHENYYLVAYDDKNEMIKHYRVDKITSVDIIDEERLGGDEFKKIDMAQYENMHFSMFSGNDEVVKLRCKNNMSGVIIDRFGKGVNIIKVDDNSFEVSVKVSVSHMFLSWIMGFAPDIKIVSPENVVNDFVALAQKAINMYEKD